MASTDVGRMRRQAETDRKKINMNAGKNILTQVRDKQPKN